MWKMKVYINYIQPKKTMVLPAHRILAFLVGDCVGVAEKATTLIGACLVSLIIPKPIQEVALHVLLLEIPSSSYAQLPKVGPQSYA